MFMDNYSDKADVICEGMNSLIVFARNADVKSEIVKKYLFINIIIASYPYIHIYIYMYVYILRDAWIDVILY